MSEEHRADESVKSNETTVSINRRKALRLLGTSAVGISGIAAGTASAGPTKSKNATNLNTNFNPNDQEQVHEFVRNIQELNEKRAINILKSLSEEQSRAAAEAMRPTEFEVEVQEDSGQIDSQAISANVNVGRTVVFKTTARNPVSGFLAYTFSHTVSWTFNGNRVLSISGEGGAANTGLSWKYQGDQTDIVNNAGNSAVSYQTGQFGQCIYVPTCVIISRTYPTINIRVDQTGTYQILKKEDGEAGE